MLAQSFATRVDWVERFVLWWASEGPKAVDPVVVAAVSTLEVSQGDFRIDALAHQLGYSARQVERRFLAAVGMTPKAFARTLRFKSALRHLCLETGQRPQEHFLEGFVDQSHLHKEFKKFSGLNPSSLAQEFSRALLVRGLLPSIEQIGAEAST